MNPDITEAHRLRGWYDSVGNSASYSEYKRDGDANTAGLCHYYSLCSATFEQLFIHVHCTGCFQALHAGN